MRCGRKTNKTSLHAHQIISFHAVSTFLGLLAKVNNNCLLCQALALEPRWQHLDVELMESATQNPIEKVRLPKKPVFLHTRLHGARTTHDWLSEPQGSENTVRNLGVLLFVCLFLLQKKKCFDEALFNNDPTIRRRVRENLIPLNCNLLLLSRKWRAPHLVNLTP